MSPNGGIGKPSHASLQADDKCSGCGVPIAWRTTHGSRGATKPIPLDVAPNDDRGNVVVRGDTATVLTRPQVLGAKATATPLYTSHFASCPHASTFRNGAKR